MEFVREPFNIYAVKAIQEGKLCGRIITFIDQKQFEVKIVESPHFPLAVVGNIVNQEGNIMRCRYQWDSHGKYTGQPDRSVRELAIELKESTFFKDIRKYSDGDLLVVEDYSSSLTYYYSSYKSFKKISDGKVEVYLHCGGKFRHYRSTETLPLGRLIEEYSKYLYVRPMTREEKIQLFSRKREVFCREFNDSTWKLETLLQVDEDGDFECESGIIYPYCFPRI